MTETETLIRPAAETDRTQLANLLHFGSHIHRHLDWRPPVEWIGKPPFLLAEKDRRLLAALASPPDPPGIAWVRLFAHTTHLTSTQAWELLWPQTSQILKKNEIQNLAAIPLHDWFKDLLIEQGFEYQHEVLLLVWDNTNEPPSALEDPGFTIRLMQNSDLEAIQEIDKQAFGPTWLNSLESTRLAFKQAHWASVAEDQGKIIGYQISTRSPTGAHLARLAVLPEHQRRGVGSALLHEIQQKCRHHQPCRLSVNTQDFNHQSLALYNKAGFKQTGEKYPVYLSKLTD